MRSSALRVELVIAVVILDQSLVALEFSFQVGELPNRWNNARSVVQMVEDRPTNRTGRDARSQRCQRDVHEPGDRRRTLLRCRDPRRNGRREVADAP